MVLPTHPTDWSSLSLSPGLALYAFNFHQHPGFLTSSTTWDLFWNLGFNFTALLITLSGTILRESDHATHYVSLQQRLWNFGATPHSWIYDSYILHGSKPWMLLYGCCCHVLLWAHDVSWPFFTRVTVSTRVTRALYVSGFLNLEKLLPRSSFLTGNFYITLFRHYNFIEY